MKGDTTLLRIVDLTNGRWKFDIKTGMNDDDLRTLLGRLKFIEKELNARLKTNIIKVTGTIEFITQK